MKVEFKTKDIGVETDEHVIVNGSMHGEKYWDRAWSLVDGCTPVSEACDNCWLAAMELRFNKCSGLLQVIDGVRQPRFSGHIICREDRLDIPLKTRKPTVWAIWSDLFHEKVPFKFIDAVFTVMKLQPHHTFLALTKRTFRAQHYIFGDKTPDNIYIGTTVENQEQADRRIPHLLQVPGNKFLSIEPMLGPIDLTNICITAGEGDVRPWCDIDSVILGGESGHGARPMHPDWVRSVREQCQAAGVPFFFKQWGDCVTLDNMPFLTFRHPPKTAKFKGIFKRVGKKAAGRILDGRTHDELPWGKKI